MFGFFKKNKVILREERNGQGYRYLSAEIDQNGDLIFEGQDLGSGVEAAFGSREYEWSWTVRAKDISSFRNVLGEKGDILDILEKRFSNEKASGLYEFMQINKIPFESWSRVGD